MGMRVTVSIGLATLIFAAGCTGGGDRSSAPSLSAAKGTTASAQGSDSASEGSAGTCDTAPHVEFSAPGKPPQPLAHNQKVTLTASVGQAVTLRFVGDCAAGGRLMINGTGVAGANSYTDVWMGQVVGSWTPRRPGTRTLAAAWACMGPESCPLGLLGYIKVHTPAA